MPVPAEVVRASLILGLAGMALVGVLYLRTRCLSTEEYIKWGLLTLLVPLLGPFLTIATQPGVPRKAPGRSSPSLEIQRLWQATRSLVDRRLQPLLKKTPRH